VPQEVAVVEEALPLSRPQNQVPLTGQGMGFLLGGKLDDWLLKLGITKSKAEAQRKIREGAVSMMVGDSDQSSWRKVTDPSFRLDPYDYPRVGNVLVLTFRIGRTLSRVRFNFQ